MKFSEQWLREWVNPNISTQELVSQLTMAGLEVDAVEAAACDFSGVVVGEIKAVEQHPDAEKLRICQVLGHAEGEKQVVCGAANARPGIKIPFATIGANLPGDFKIKKAKLRGVESFGMLCGQTELRLGDDDSGLWELPGDAPVGMDLRQWLKLDDAIIEVDLTPNRSDCLSVRGMAREVGALNKIAVTEPIITAIEAQVDDQFDVQLLAPEACPAYAGRVIKGVDLSRPSPVWLVEKLRRGGIRSIDPVVDVTNFVLLELGQPMHAFDLSKLHGSLYVRFAKAAEPCKLLNGQVLELRDDTLVIADDKGVLAVAGIMGGAESAVSTATENIFLESAFFAPESVAGKARSYGLHTDSSHRFERGVDYCLQTQALQRATSLLLDIVGGQPGPVVLRQDESSVPAVRRVTLTRQRLQKGLSLDLGAVDVADILQRLGLTVESTDASGWTLSVPSYRFDISIEADLLEEVARVYGYDRLPTRAMTFTSDLDSHSETHTPQGLVRNYLCSGGYQEVITYSFVDPEIHRTLFPTVSAMALKNPISAEMASMRTSLLPGLLQTLTYNLNRQQVRAKLFEVGMVFQSPTQNVEDLQQSNKIAGLVYGSHQEVSWAQKAREADFFDVKGTVEGLLAIGARGRAVTFQPLVACAFLHPGQSASIFVDGEEIGYVGALHPVVTKNLDFAKTVWVFECSLSGVSLAQVPAFRPLSRFPAVTRDIAVVVDKAVCVADLESTIRKVAVDVLKELKLFDVYSGEGIDPQRKSLAFSLTFQSPTRTLTDEEVNASMASVVQCLEGEYGANLR